MSDMQTGAPGRAGTRLSAVAWIAAIYTYLLIVFGGIVRITGSGLGCGDDWPRCNGQWIPTFDLETFIEWFHRLLAAGMFLPIGALLALALMHRKEASAAERNLVVPAVAAVVMLVVQALLGALTVRLELEAPTVTVLHFGLANLLLALLIGTAARAGAIGAGRAPAVTEEAASGARKLVRTAVAAAGIGFLVLLMGAFTANVGKTPGAAGAGPAAWACGVVEGSFFRSFPLCNGEWLPASGGGG
ncbi:MAG TPA: COX15/CtaA family protein, partial [Longimicrobiales bacterium]|nr:COX15/CtaA family protein [Longimicrobiales bacterium]